LKTPDVNKQNHLRLTLSRYFVGGVWAGI